MLEKFHQFLPGVLLLVAIAGVSLGVSQFLPAYFGAVFVAVVLGIVVANTVDLDPKVYQPGIRLGLKKFLKLAIILLGAGISFQEILGVGVPGLMIIVVLIAMVFALTFVLGRWLGVSFRQMLLIAAGVSICGNTAVVTTAPLVEAKDDEVAMAVGVVTLFGVLTVLLYPFIGHWLAMGDQAFGMWAGTAVNDTSQVVAAGFIFSEDAGVVATTVKLTRNVMLVPVVLLIAFLYRRQVKGGGGEKVSALEVFPTFVLGFLALAMANSLGWIPAQLSDGLVEASKLLILLALSGIGLGVEIKALRRLGGKPFALGFAVEVALALAALGLIWLVLSGF